jgi:hypothetical protein
VSIYTDFGIPVSENIDLVEPLQHLYDACVEHPDFEVIEVRTSETPCDTIVVDCCNDQVPSRNSTGIKNRERLAFLYTPQSAIPYEVRALRKDFPVTLHQNDIPDSEPASLCIYFEPWNAVERSWTPQQFLKRILWWLKETANGTLHREGQPLEQLYFRSPVVLVLPVDFDEQIANKELKFSICWSHRPRENITVYRGVFQNIESNDEQVPKIECIVISPSPVLHAPIDRFPQTLGELQLIIP